jgi:hypothetical protein
VAASRKTIISIAIRATFSGPVGTRRSLNSKA